eukprot:TRINITY_DN49073_c0_g1_i1.p1 TRINITY_DN49073_c0_g1~~TRINITY_DN49073_c0_g1_i1.p1  ORF type:complete len:142 (+),score=20.24 TRINITY_DN49073_c0_g1_i1:89-514(+)
MPNSKGKVLKFLVLMSAVAMITNSLTKTCCRDVGFVGEPKAYLQPRLSSKAGARATSRQQESEALRFQEALQKDDDARRAGTASAVVFLLNLGSCVFWAVFIHAIFIEGYYAKYIEMQETLRTATVQGLGGVSVPLFPQGD